MAGAVAVVLVGVVVYVRRRRRKQPVPKPGKGDQVALVEEAGEGRGPSADSLIAPAMVGNAVVVLRSDEDNESPAGTSDRSRELVVGAGINVHNTRALPSTGATAKSITGRGDDTVTSVQAVPLALSSCAAPLAAAEPTAPTVGKGHGVSNAAVANVTPKVQHQCIGSNGSVAWPTHTVGASASRSVPVGPLVVGATSYAIVAAAADDKVIRDSIRADSQADTCCEGVSTSKDGRHAHGPAVNMIQAVMDAAETLAEHSIVPGISEAAALVGVLVRLATDHRSNPVSVEKRVRWCRSIVAMLERAAELLGKVRSTRFGRANRAKNYLVT